MYLKANRTFQHYKYFLIQFSSPTFFQCCVAPAYASAQLVRAWMHSGIRIYVINPKVHHPSPRLDRRPHNYNSHPYNQ